MTSPDAQDPLSDLTKLLGRYQYLVWYVALVVTAILCVLVLER